MLDFKAMMKKLNWWDIGLVKVGVLFFTLLLVKWLPELNNIDWKISTAIVVVIWVYLVWKMFLKK
jgi:hypothetical protein